MKSIANIQETLQKLQTIIITDAEQKKEDQKKQNRKLLISRRERKRRKRRFIGKSSRKIKKCITITLKAVGEQAKGILGRLMEAFTLIFTGWLADKGFKAIQAFMDGDKEKLKSIGMNVLAGLGIVGGIFVAMNVRFTWHYL